MATTAASPRPGRGNDLDDYDLAELREMFGSPSPPPASGEVTDKKRKQQHEDLGLEGEVSVAKRARVPQVKLDEQRLLSDQGIPKLRSRARCLRFKGKGHEFSDTERLLAFYQLWLDDLFPKAKFLDSLVMVEKAGHKSVMVGHRKEWIAEARRKESGLEDDTALGPERGQADPAQDREPERRTSGVGQGTRHKTPTAGASTGAEDELYYATPLRKPSTTDTDKNTTAGTGVQVNGVAPIEENEDEDDLDALMREFDDGAVTLHTTATGAKLKAAAAPNQHMQPAVTQDFDEFADDEAAMAEMGDLW